MALCPLLKISLGNPYLKIRDLSEHFVADAYMQEYRNLYRCLYEENFFFTPSQSTLKYGTEG